MIRKRTKILVQGIVQGVGFRPFVYREAVKENLKGYVANSSHGVEIEVEGTADAVERFLRQLRTNPPVMANITNIETGDIHPMGEGEFLIKSSKRDKERSTLISPDMSVCDDCMNEMNEPGDRRFQYPFINCTNCGPRYTIIQDIPYDRPKTTMSKFKMCKDCSEEYEDPLNRRFHAQPNACAICGPHIWLTDREGVEIHTQDSPIREVADHIRSGKIVAVKGLGGFHLACDAFQEEAVNHLRQRKGREEKPLAVMTLDIDAAKTFAHLTPQEIDMLISARRPIVLLKKHPEYGLADSVAPRNAYIGIMIAYTPLHRLILQEGFTALVMTSGNLSEEPIAIGNEEAIVKLGDVADLFLFHDRDIEIRSDDSVTRIAGGLPRMIRRSRGYVPMPVFLRKSFPSVLAVGGELKNTICYTKEDKAFLSQHIGDLENLETLTFFEETVTHLSHMLQVKPVALVHDLHPDYLSTQWALKQTGIRLIAVQHHHAHIASCLAENGVDDRVIGLSLDGTGYGLDGTIWGGEILICDMFQFDRAGHFASRLMPGGSKVIQEPWRMGISYMYNVFTRINPEFSNHAFLEWMAQYPLAERASSEAGQAILNMVHRQFQTMKTSSLGRLFDGVAAIIGMRDVVAFEGQAAMELEMLMREEQLGALSDSYFQFEIIQDDGRLIISPDGMLESVLDSIRDKVPIDEISHRFHTGIVHILVESCKRLRRQTGLETVALSGGCFQNRFLIEHLPAKLEEDNFRVLTHTHVPTNDGGIALGQAVIASYQIS